MADPVLKRSSIPCEILTIGDSLQVQLAGVVVTILLLFFLPGLLSR